ncbi:hypothetical protein COU79_03930 [Candidatus Peregrinibacteria bacterium CG10_big_fil_rev_8_21_14_0_10_54_7]|nr:MAG: hypothetical protein COU79_03930 [Candidatus Peregrinibacteria bacterium CG10_big_fil_rev_8_21_14_0_10_54_7]
MPKPEKKNGGKLAEISGVLPKHKLGPFVPQKQSTLFLALICAVVSALYIWGYAHVQLTTVTQTVTVFLVLSVGVMGGSLLVGILYALLRGERIKDETDFYEALLNAQSELGEGLIIMEEDRIIYANDACRTISGYTSEEFSAMPSFLLIVVPEQRATLAERLRKRIQGEVVEEQYETAILHKDGRRVDLEISIKKFNVKNAMRLVVIARDISERKKIDNAKNEFVSWVSHQLRTPLTASNFLAEMLLAGDDGKLTIEQTRSIEKIYDANQRMISLINSLLNVARIELGTLVVECSPTNLAEISNSVLDVLRPQIEIKNLNVQRIYDREMPLVNTDPNLVLMIFQNLLSNAVKYTNKGGITVSIKRSAQNMLISITDTGMGIPKRDQENIFGKLFRATNVLTKEIEGTGLGLYIIKAIVELFEGGIWFDSEEEKGTTFYISLPLKQNCCSLREPNFL